MPWCLCAVGWKKDPLFPAVWTAAVWNFYWIFSLIKPHFRVQRPTFFVMEECDRHWCSLRFVVFCKAWLNINIGPLVGAQQKHVIAQKPWRRYNTGVGVITSSQLILAQLNSISVTTCPRTSAAKIYRGLFLEQTGFSSLWLKIWVIELSALWSLKSELMFTHYL